MPRTRLIWVVSLSAFYSTRDRTKGRSICVFEYSEMLYFIDFYSSLTCLWIPPQYITFELFSQRVLTCLCEIAWSLHLGLAILFAFDVLCSNADYCRTPLIFYFHLENPLVMRPADVYIHFLKCPYIFPSVNTSSNLAMQLGFFYAKFQKHREDDQILLFFSSCHPHREVKDFIELHIKCKARKASKRLTLTFLH